MQTQTHVFLALALFARPKRRVRNWAVLAGALATDAFIYIGFLYWVPLKGQSAAVFFRETYFEASLQFWSALSNSLPLYAALAVGAWAARAKKWGHEVWSDALLFFALAGFTQSAIDLPVHADDAHRHFWPITDFRFLSPISYWDPDYYGRLIGPLDMTLGLICLLILWRRFEGLWARLVFFLFGAAYIAMLLIVLINFARD